MKPEELKQLFDNNSNCYADMSDDSVVLAMDQGRFVEVVTKLLDQHAQQSAIPPLDPAMREKALAEHREGKSICGESYLKQTRALLLDTEQPVDWPTEPGWWWMDRPGCKPTLVNLFPGVEYVRIVSIFKWTRQECNESGTRFLPAHAPTFPPREKE